MKTPTPQEQAEMLIEAFLFQDNYGIAENTGIPGIESEEIAIKSAIVKVKTVIKALNEDIPWFEFGKNNRNTKFLQESGDAIGYWQEVLTILKGKL